LCVSLTGYFAVLLEILSIISIAEITFMTQ
jgi:hypothetical protein